MNSKDYDRFKWYLETTSKVMNKMKGKKENMGRYNVGDKFTIEISEIINDAVAHIGPYYKIKGFDSFVFDEKGLDRLSSISSCAQDIYWNKVEVDTPILVSHAPKIDWYRRYFAKYEDGKVYAWNDGATSWTAITDDDVTYWERAKLAEVEK